MWEVEMVGDGRNPVSPTWEDGQEVPGGGGNCRRTGEAKSLVSGLGVLGRLGGLRFRAPRVAWEAPRPRPAGRLGRSDAAVEAGGGGSGAPGR